MTAGGNMRKQLSGGTKALSCCDSFRRWEHGEENGEEGEGAAVNKGRRADAQDARAREDEDDGDRAQIEADGRRDASESEGTWSDAGGRARKEDGVRSRWEGGGIAAVCLIALL
jgi:hypothetical protein